MPRGRALADALGVSPSTAWDLIRRLKRSGALTEITTVSLRPQICECVTYLKVQGLKAGALEALDRRIIADPAVILAARIAGDFDYRLQSLHSDYRSANDWSRAFEADPAVFQITTRICSTVIKRPHYAAAILGAAGICGE